MSAFWDWAVRAYARPGAAEACLALQDAQGQNVPLMLWAVWRARSGAAPDNATVAQAADIAQQWEQAAVSPLRGVRRSLRSPLNGPAERDREGLRQQVKAVELEAERLVMAALEALGQTAAAPEVAEAELLARVSAAYGGPLPPEAFGDLLAAL